MVSSCSLCEALPDEQLQVSCVSIAPHMTSMPILSGMYPSAAIATPVENRSTPQIQNLIWPMVIFIISSFGVDWRSIKRSRTKRRLIPYKQQPTVRMRSRSLMRNTFPASWTEYRWHIFSDKALIRNWISQLETDSVLEGLLTQLGIEFRR